MLKYTHHKCFTRIFTFLCFMHGSMPHHVSVVVESNTLISNAKIITIKNWLNSNHHECVSAYQNNNNNNNNTMQ